MYLKKLICIFLLVVLAGRSSIAEEIKPEFTHIKTGEAAKFTGYLFTPEAIAKIYSSCDESIKICKLECESEVSSLRIEVQRVTELKIIELAVKDKLITDITNLKNKEIAAREKLLADIEDERLRNKFYIAGAFVGGILLTGSIFYIANSVGK